MTTASVRKPDMLFYLLVANMFHFIFMGVVIKTTVLTETSLRQAHVLYGQDKRNNTIR